ncbi:MAG: peptide chain release factor N(5)-glutamine methyltransferase [Magnetococcales bacterium]|nr:peptide chain release factor N(5)-glutamine methyltransferase [Magnetococcales bacterium]
MSSVKVPLWTVRRLIQWGSGWLEERGVEQSRFDVELLLARVLNLSRMDLFLDMDRPLDQPELAAFKNLIIRRGKREPVAYILQQRGFWKRSFQVDPSVLIPRPETESLIESVLGLFPDRDNPPRNILDIGIGSGTILLTLLEEFPNAIGTGIDLSEAAIKVATRNRAAFNLEERASLMVGDLTGPLDRSARFDLIVSNPPYIATGVLATLQPEVVDREPRLALDGGTDGLNLYRRLIPEAVGFLDSPGWLVVEIGHDQGAEVSALFSRSGLEKVSVLPDYGQRDRLVLGCKTFSN